jgi:D-methionine transport system permease protein
MLETLFPHLKLAQLWAATQETLYMTALSGAATLCWGSFWTGAVFDRPRRIISKPRAL